MLTEDQRMQMMYTGLANCFCAERSLSWSRSQLMSIINLAGLPILVAPQTPVWLRFLTEGFGIALCVFWVLVNWRMRSRINYWQDCLANMEPAETPLIVFRVFTGKQSEKIRKPPRIYAVNLLPWAFLAVWSIGLLVTITLYLLLI